MAWSGHPYSAAWRKGWQVRKWNESKIEQLTFRVVSERAPFFVVNCVLYYDSLAANMMVLGVQYEATKL